MAIGKIGESQRVILVLDLGTSGEVAADFWVIAHCFREKEGEARLFGENDSFRSLIWGK